MSERVPAYNWGEYWRGFNAGFVVGAAGGTLGTAAGVIVLFYFGLI